VAKFWAATKAFNGISVYTQQICHLNVWFAIRSSSGTTTFFATNEIYTRKKDMRRVLGVGTSAARIIYPSICAPTKLLLVAKLTKTRTPQSNEPFVQKRELLCSILRSSKCQRALATISSGKISRDQPLLSGTAATAFFVSTERLLLSVSRILRSHGRRWISIKAYAVRTLGNTGTLHLSAKEPRFS
jgi:hypothetical protein